MSIALVSTGCGNVFVRGAIQPGFTTITGTVSIVQVISMPGAGSFLQVTLVTFLVNGAPSTVGFCGDQSSQFPVNQVVTTHFDPGQSCANLIVVIIT